MIFLAIIIGIIFIFLIIQCIQRNYDVETYGFGVFCGLALVAALVLEIIFICESVSEPYPTAMDVYQGKTILEYTIRDGEIIDSVVVWKGDIDNED